MFIIFDALIFDAVKACIQSCVPYGSPAYMSILTGWCVVVLCYYCTTL